MLSSSLQTITALIHKYIPNRINTIPIIINGILKAEISLFNNEIFLATIIDTPVIILIDTV